MRVNFVPRTLLVELTVKILSGRVQNTLVVQICHIDFFYVFIVTRANSKKIECVGGGGVGCYPGKNTRFFFPERGQFG